MMEGLAMARMVLILVLAFSLIGCTTANPNMFSGKAVIQLDQGTFFVTYVKMAMTYAVFRYQVIEACTAKIIPQATCDSLAESDKGIQKIAAEINDSIQNPAYPVDMQKVQIFIDLVLGTLVKVGVKGIAL
jgi:hypothetical protein